MFRTKNFKMKNLPLAKDLIKEWQKADSERRLTHLKLKDLGLTDKMISFLQNKPGVEIVEFKSDKIVYNTTEKVEPHCDWFGRGEQTMKALSNGKLQIEETYL